MSVAFLPRSLDLLAGLQQQPAPAGALEQQREGDAADAPARPASTATAWREQRAVEAVLDQDGAHALEHRGRGQEPGDPAHGERQGGDRVVDGRRRAG